MVETESQMTHQVRLLISNIEVLERNTKPNCIFDIQGGSIGSGPEEHWYLYDRSAQISPAHALIKVIDDHFCIEQGSGDIYVNQSNYPLGHGQSARLQDADLIQMGNFTLRVQLSLHSDFRVDLNALLEQVIDDEEQPTLLIDDQYMLREAPLPIVPLDCDPELALDESIAFSDGKDPEKLLKTQAQLSLERHALSDIVDDQPEILDADQALAYRSSEPMQRVNKHSSYIQNLGSKNTTIKGVDNVSNDFSSKMEDLEDLVMGTRGVAIDNVGENSSDKKNLTHTSTSAPNYSNTNRGVSEADHLASSPLQQGLEVALKQIDSAQHHEVLEEIGQTLKEAVQGLLNIHASAKQQGQSLHNKILQPIEDNPLRLGLDYPTTMAAMFDSDRSKVHLSAPMAVNESLTHIMLHQIATEHATQKALDAILQALNPNTLSLRFRRYRGTHTKGKEGGSEGWEWEMYKHYYQELISSRQQGFEKLYSEVFEQAYDLRLRELQLESANNG